MKLLDTTLRITKDGYVKNEDDWQVLYEEAEAILAHSLSLLEEDLDQAGFRLAREAGRR